jgi:hypothetical protein
VLKSQDIVVLLHLAAHGHESWTFASVHQQLGISASEVHAALNRAALARLYDAELRTPQRHALTEFCLHGLKYVFPATLGGPSRGIGTCGGSPFPCPFVFEQNDTPVWPHPEGNQRGPAVEPLYPSLPKIIEQLPALYSLLVLVDFIRLGRARERQWAEKSLSEQLLPGYSTQNSTQNAAQKNTKP